MSLNKVIGYSIAVLHAVLIGFVLITPFVTSNLILLATVFELIVTRKHKKARISRVDLKISVPTNMILMF